MKKLQKEYGPILESGSGAITINSLLHPISKSSSMLALLAFNRETSSDWWEPSYRASSELRRKRHCKSRASWRFIIDTKDMSNGYHIVGPGQSGHFRSDWYHDQIDDWVNGTYHTTTLNTEG